MEWSVSQEVPFITSGAWYTDFELNYYVPDTILNSEIWNDSSQIEVIVENSLNENITNLFTQTKLEEMIKVEALETALMNPNFYGEIYQFTFRLHIDNNTFIEEKLLDESGFMVTDALVSRTSKNQRLRETISSTVTSNRTNFNSMVTLDSLTSDGDLLETQVVEDTLTHEITINPPKIEGYDFDYVKSGIDLRNIRLNSTNISLELIYDKMIQPDIPAINPEDGILELENTNPNNMKWLAIRYVSELDFVETTFTENGQELFSLPSISHENNEIANIVTIQDMRPDDKRDGWQLHVRQISELGGGAQIIMNPEVHESFLTGNDLNIHKGDFILDTDSQVFASASETNSNQIISFGMHSSNAEGVKLLIPPGMGVGSYQTTLEWSLVSGPVQAIIN